MVYGRAGSADRLKAADAIDELEPGEGEEPRDGRPATEPLRVIPAAAATVPRQCARNSPPYERPIARQGLNARKSRRRARSGRPCQARR